MTMRVGPHENITPGVGPSRRQCMMGACIAAGDDIGQLVLYLLANYVRTGSLNAYEAETGKQKRD